MSAPAVTLVPRRLSELTVGLPAPYWYLLAGLLVNRAGGFVVPLLSIYLTTVRQLTLVEAGTIVSLYGLGSMGGTTLGGVLADRWGRRATLLLAQGLGAALMLALGQARTVPQLAACTFLLGLAFDMFRPASQALVADVVAPEYRMKAFTWFYWCVNLGFAFASLVGGWAASRSFSVLFVVDAAGMLAFAVVTYLKIPETRPARRPEHHDEGSLLTPWTDRRFLPFLLLNFALALVFFQHLTALPEDLRRKGLSPADYGAAVATNGVLIVLLQPVVAAWIGRWGRPQVLAAAALVTGLGFGLTAWAHTLPAYMLTVAVWTMGELLQAPVNASLVADLSPAVMRGRYQGAFSVTFSLAMMLGSAVGPRLAAVTGLDGVWAACALIGAAVAVGHLHFTRRALTGLR